MFKGPLVVETYLKKKKQKPNLNTKTSLRYFKFDMSENNFSFKDNKETPEIKSIHIARDLIGFGDKVDPEDENICDWSFGFKIITAVKTYVLFAESKEVFMRWIRLLNLYFNKIDILNSQSVQNLNSFASSMSEDLNDSKTTPKRELHTIPAAMNMNSNHNHLSNNDDFLDDDLDLLKEIETANDVNDNKQTNNVFEMLSNKSVRESSNSLNKINDVDKSHSTSKSQAKNSKTNITNNFNFNNGIEDEDWGSNIRANNFKLGNTKQNLESNIKVASKSPSRQMVSESGIIPEIKIKRESNANISPVKSINRSSIDLNKRFGHKFNNLNDSEIKQERMNTNVNIKKEEVSKENMSKINSKEGFSQQSQNEINHSLRMQSVNQSVNQSINHNSDNLQLKNKVDWKELNDDWGYNKPTKPAKSVNDLLNKSANNENLVIQPKNKPRITEQVNLFDDSRLHIKKSTESKRVSIENLHYGDNVPIPKFNNIDGGKPVSKSKSPISTYHPPGNRKKTMYEGDINPHDVNLDASRMIKISEGEEVNVKRKIIKPETTGNSFVMNLVVPEKLTKNENTVDRVKLISERLLNPVYENSVYTGKVKGSIQSNTPGDVNTSSIILNNTVNLDNNRESSLLYEPSEFAQNENKKEINVAEMIMKSVDKKTYFNNLKSRTSVKGNQIHEEVPHDEYHTRIMKTFKVEKDTFLGDDFHMPSNLVKDPPKKENIKQNPTNNQTLLTTIENNRNNPKNEGFFVEDMQIIDHQVIKETYISSNVEDISRIERRYSQLNLEEVWDTSIIEDELMFDV